MTDDRRHINWDMIARHLMDVATDEEREEVERVTGNITVRQNDILKPITRGKKLVWWIPRERGMNLLFMRINPGKHISGE